MHGRMRMSARMPRSIGEDVRPEGETTCVHKGDGRTSIGDVDSNP